jgi:hypothetical protein
VENKELYQFFREEIGTMNHLIMLRRDRVESAYQSFAPVEVPVGHYLMLATIATTAATTGRSVGSIATASSVAAHAIAFSWDYDHHHAPRLDRFFEAPTR